MLLYGHTIKAYYFLSDYVVHIANRNLQSTVIVFFYIASDVIRTAMRATATFIWKMRHSDSVIMHTCMFMRHPS